MKRLAFALLVLSLTSATLAVDDPPKPAEKPAPSLGARADKLIKESLPICADDMKETRVALTHELPNNMLGAVIRLESKHSACDGQ